MPLIKRSVQGWPHGAHTAAFEETAVLRKYSIWDELTPWRDRRRAVA